jgi:hypothetical protein
MAAGVSTFNRNATMRTTSSMPYAVLLECLVTALAHRKQNCTNVMDAARARMMGMYIHINYKLRRVRSSRSGGISSNSVIPFPSYQLSDKGNSDIRGDAWGMPVARVDFH